MKRILSLVLALFAASALAVDIPVKNPSSGGALQVKGNTSGATPCTGCIGETIEVFSGSSTYGQTAAANTWTDASAMGTITLTAGTWNLCYNVEVDSNNLTASLAVPTVGTSMYDGSATVSGSVGYISPYVPPSNDVTFQMNSCVVYKVTSGTKTISMQTRTSSAPANLVVRILGTSITGGLTDPDSQSRLWATRIY